MSVTTPSGASAIRSPALTLLHEPISSAKGSLLESLLREQQTLTAVERFSLLHAHDAAPAQARYYRDLIPAGLPGQGQQYAFEVDLDACTGCKACVAGCHSLNGLDDDESFRSVGLLHGGSAGAGYLQTVTTSCHHCVDPACMSGCPVNAYEKDPVTGIVRHLDDQCIGCQYCTLMCPYDAPKYNSARGIVRKCDMCSDRLSAGEAPACVQACPNEAIRIRIVDQSDAVKAADAGTFLPGAPGPQDTIPTTVYRTERAVPVNTLPADFYTTRAEHGHPSLVIMLVLSQLAVGAFALAYGIGRFAMSASSPLPHALFALALAGLALGLGSFHLGRPLYAFRAFLGIGHSWMSREIVAFGLFAPLGALYAFLSAPRLHGWALGNRIPAQTMASLAEMVGLTASIVGLLGVFSSVMIYAATKRPHWRAGPTGFRFFATTLVLGAASVYMIGTLVEGAVAFSVGLPARTLIVVVLVVSTAKLLVEALSLRHISDRGVTPLRRVATVLLYELRPLTILRFLAGGIGGPMLASLLLLAARTEATTSPGIHAVLAVTSLVMLLAGELIERHLFFRAAPASRMPGGLP